MAGYWNINCFFSNQLCWPLPPLTVQIRSAITIHPLVPTTLTDSSSLTIKPFYFLFLQHNDMHLFLSSWSLSFITIGRRQPFHILQPKYNSSHLSLQSSTVIHISMTCLHQCKSLLKIYLLRKAASVVLLQLLLTRQAPLLAGPFYVTTSSYLVYSLTVPS